MPDLYKAVIPKVCAVLYLVCFGWPSAAQQNFSVQHYTSEDGLPQNSIKSIAADSEGFIWLATEDGLTRFDGRRFLVFGKSSASTTSKRVISIVPGRRNPKNKSQILTAFAHFVSDSIGKISAGSATLLGNDLQVWRLNLKELRSLRKEVYVTNGLPEKWSLKMLPDAPSLLTDSYQDGNFFLCDRLKVAYYKQWKKQFEIEHETHLRQNYFLLGGRLYHFDGKSSFIQIFDGQKRGFPAKGDIVVNPSFAKHKSEAKIYWNQNSDQAFIYLDGWLFELVQATDGTLTTRLLIRHFDLPFESIDVVFFDRSNRKVFLGSSTNGLFVLSAPYFETIKVSGADRPNIFYAQVPNDDNSILTSTGIVAGKDTTKGIIIDRRIPELEKVNSDDRRFIFKDQQGNVWIKNGYALIRLNRDNQVTGQWRFPNWVKAVCQISESEFWIGVYNAGIFKLNTQNTMSEPAFIGGKAAKYITCVSVKSANELWVGTLSGLYLVNLQSGRTTLVPKTSRYHITSIQPHERGRFWVTAVDKGLMILDSGNRIVNFPLDRRGFLGSAHYAFHDGNGFLWVPTNRGLFQMAISDLSKYARLRWQTNTQSDTNYLRKPYDSPFYAYHSKNEGFASNEFNGGCNSCGLKLKNGYVSLPSIDGLVWFKPNQIPAPVSDGSIVLDGVSINNVKSNASGDTIELPMEPENVRFSLSTAHFGNPHNLHLSYAMIREGEGVSPSDWQPIDSENEILVRYSSLNSGKYILKIRKRAGFGAKESIVKEIRVIVPEIWYATREAITAFAALLIALLVFGVRLYNKYRLKAIQSEKEVLEKIVDMRTITLQTTLTELDEQVHIMSRMIASISHDIQTPLSQIAVASEDIPDLIKADRLEDAANVATMMAAVSERTSKMLNDLLNYIKIQVYGKRICFEDINLDDLVTEKIELFEGTIKRHQNTLQVSVPKDLYVRSDYQLLSIIIHNLIDNAAKYTRRGLITFNVEMSEDFVELVISNSGQPLPPQKVSFINNASVQDNASHALQHGGNLGLIIVKEVSQLIGVKAYLTQTDTVNFHIVFTRTQ